MSKLNLKKLIFKKSVVAVEIGNDWLKILKNEPFSFGKRITRVYFQKLVHINESVSDTISRVFKDMRANRSFVVTYLPRHLVTVRILEFPSTDSKEIRNMIDLQVGKQTPYSREEIISGYKIIDNGKDGYTKVMLVIARRNIIRERVGALQKAGIEVRKVGVSTEGVYNWFSIAYMPEVKQSDLQAVILIDIDSNYSDFIVIYKRKLAFTRSILIGSNYLLEELDKWQDKFVEELRHSIDLFRNEEKELKISKVFLSGAARHVKNLDRVLSMELDIPAEVTDHAKNIRIKKNIPILQDRNFRFVSISPLIGTAVKNDALELDLTPGEFRIQKLMEKKRKQLVVVGVLFTSIVMMASLLLLINIYNKNTYLLQLKQKITRIEAESNEVEKMRVRINFVEERLDARGSSINILNEIYKLVSKEIYFTKINIEEKKRVILRGRAFAMSDVFKFVTTLENSPYFKTVKTTYTTTKKEKDTEYADFEIMCTYEDAN